MRRAFAQELHKQMTLNTDIYLLIGDLGYGMWDQVRKDYPNRVINTGASEQAMLDMAVGLALEGKRVFVYTISSFFLRCGEAINLYMHNEQLPIVLVGSGVDDSYKHDGYSHNCTMAQRYMMLLDMDSHYPKDKEDIPKLLSEVLQSNKPSVLFLQR